MLILTLVCCKNNETWLDSFFEQLEKECSEEIIDKFRNAPFEDAVINNFEFNEIFVKGTNALLSDKGMSDKFKAYFAQHDIQLIGRQDKWVVIAAFHKFLNEENYQIEQLWTEMAELSNKEYERG